MTPIFVQIKCELGQAYQTADAAINQLDYVSEVYSTSGQYDLLIKCYLPEGVDAGHFINEYVQKLPYVRDTFTIVTFKAF